MVQDILSVFWPTSLPLSRSFIFRHFQERKEKEEEVKEIVGWYCTDSYFVVSSLWSPSSSSSSSSSSLSLSSSSSSSFSKRKLKLEKLGLFFPTEDKFNSFSSSLSSSSSSSSSSSFPSFFHIIQNTNKENWRGIALEEGRKREEERERGEKERERREREREEKERGERKVRIIFFDPPCQSGRKFQLKRERGEKEREGEERGEERERKSEREFFGPWSLVIGCVNSLSLSLLLSSGKESSEERKKWRREEDEEEEGKEKEKEKEKEEEKEEGEKEKEEEKRKEKKDFFLKEMVKKILFSFQTPIVIAHRFFLFSSLFSFLFSSLFFFSREEREKKTTKEKRKEKRREREREREKKRNLYFCGIVDSLLALFFLFLLKRLGEQLAREGEERERGERGERERGEREEESDWVLFLSLSFQYVMFVLLSLLSSLSSFVEFRALWLCQWPIGFKLNDELSLLLARPTFFVLHQWGKFFSSSLFCVFPSLLSSPLLPFEISFPFLSPFLDNERDPISLSSSSSSPSSSFDQNLNSRSLFSSESDLLSLFSSSSFSQSILETINECFVDFDQNTLSSSSWETLSLSSLYSWGQIFSSSLFSSLSFLLSSLSPFSLSWGEILLYICIGIGGFSLFLSLLSDFIMVSCSHFTSLYFILKYWVSLWRSFLSNLFLLFQGKKRNSEKGGRLEVFSFEIDQLVIGTILFTVLLILFPTLIAFFLLFVVVRFLILSALLFLWVGRYCLMWFPLFDVFLLLFDSTLFPSSICLIPLASSSSSSQSKKNCEMEHVQLKSVGTSVGTILGKFFRKASSSAYENFFI